MKISSMWKLSSIAILSSTLFASNADDNVLNFLKKSITSNNGSEVKSITIKSSQNIKQIPNWKVYYVNVEVFFKKEKKDQNITEIVFSDGSYYVRDFINLNTKKSLKSELSPKAQKSLYDDEHFLAGDKNAKNKLLVFSDPNCPFCMSFMPLVIDAAKKHPKEFALYYYHFPLNIHKSAKSYVKAMLVAEKEGIKDVVYKTYKAKLRSSDESEKKIAEKFNKVFGAKITVKQMNEPWVLKKIQKDEQIANDMMVNSTPTLYINDKKDPKRLNFKALYEKAESKK